MLANPAFVFAISIFNEDDEFPVCVLYGWTVASYKTLFSCVIGVIAVMSLAVYRKSSLPVPVRQINTLTLM